MKKNLFFYVGFLIGFFPAILQANTLLKHSGKVVKHLAAPSGVGKIFSSIPSGTLSVRVPVSSLPQRLDLERYVISALPKPTQMVPLRLSHPNDGQWIMLQNQYEAVIRDFRSFKTEMDGLLYYQAKPTERTPLNAEEKKEIVSRIGMMTRKLNSLWLSIPADDKAFQFAREYVNYTVRILVPDLLPIFDISAPVLKRDDRIYSASEFFLRNPSELSFVWKWFLPRHRQLSQNVNRWVPQGLRIAVLNDRASFLNAIRTKHQKGLLWNSSELTLYSNAENLLDDILVHGKDYDVILVDLLVPGGGGFFVANSLRQKDFGGVLLAASAFPESAERGKFLFERGFDGMFCLPENFEETFRWEHHLSLGLRNYFFYRHKNSWIR